MIVDSAPHINYDYLNKIFTLWGRYENRHCAGQL